MSIDMILEDSQSQAQTTTSYCQHQLEGYQAIQQAINQFVSDTESLKGKAYDSARTFAETVLQALARGGELYEETLSQLISKLPNDYIEMVDGKSWREDELLQRIDQQQQCLNVLEEAELQLSLISVMSLERKTSLHQYHAELIEMHAELKRTYEEILEKLYAFDTYSASIFDALADIDTQMTLGLSQIDQSWNAQTGTFQTMANMSWATVLNNQYAVKDVKATTEEKTFMANLMTQYGFDAETAQIILDVKRGIDKEFPKLSQDERDYLLLRLIGSVSYGAVNGTTDEILWNTTAGDLTNYFYHEKSTASGNSVYRVGMTYDEIMAKLGISAEDSETLYKNLTLQHGLSGADLTGENLLKYAEGTVRDYKDNKGIDITVEEVLAGIETMNHKADFTHQSITMATHLRPSTYPLINGQVEDLAGWEGDTTRNANERDPSIGIDDYLADLDAVNLTSRMSSGQSYMTALNSYQSELRAGKTTREAEFKQNIDLKEIKTTIFSSLVPKEVVAVNPVTGAPIYASVSEDEAMAYLQENYEGSYLFIQSLEEEENLFGEDN